MNSVERRIIMDTIQRYAEEMTNKGTDYHRGFADGLKHAVRLLTGGGPWC